MTIIFKYIKIFRHFLDGEESDKEASKLRSSLDMLCRVYPHMKRAELQFILHRCHGDVIQAIEHVKRTHGDAAAAQTKSDPTSPSFDLHMMSPTRTGGLSPLMASLATLNHPALLRYAYAANAAASLTANPFPGSLLSQALPLIPTSTPSSLYQSLNNNLSETASKSLFGHLGCQCIFGKPCNIYHPKHLMPNRPSPSLLELRNSSPTSN